MAGKGTLRVRIVGDSSGLERTLKKTSGVVSKFGKTALLGLGAAAAAGVAGSIKAFADFDAAMTQSLAIMGDVSDAMRKDMSEAAREVGRTTSFSAKEAADSYFFLASAGMDAKQSVEALPQVAAFAQAGMFDMKTATDLATDAQSALGMTSDNTKENIKQLTRTTDVFVKANTLANASVQQFATAMTQKAGAALRSLGKDIEEGTATLAVFADQGIKGERAGTILRNTLDGLAVQSRENAEKFQEMGVKVFDAQGNMRNMADITSDLEDGLAGMSTEQREAALSALGFNKRTREGILALLGNSEALREYEGQLRNAGGTAQEVADNQLDTFWEQLGLLRDQVVDLGIDLGSKLVPHIRNFVEAVRENMPLIEETIGSLMEAFGALFSTTQSGSGNTASAVEGMGLRSADAMSSWASSTNSTSQSIEESLRSVKDFIENDLTPAFESINTWWQNDGQEMASTATNTLNGLKGFLQSDFVPAWEIGIGAIIAKIAGWKVALGAATVEMMRRMKNLAISIGESIGEMINSFLGLESGAAQSFGSIGGLISHAKVQIASWAVAVGEHVSTAAGWFQSLPGRIASALGGLAGRLKTLGAQAIAGLIAGLRSRLSEALSTVRNLASDIISTAADALDIRSPSRVFMRMGANVAQGFIDGVREGDIPTRFRHILGKLVGIGEEKFEELSGVLSSMADKATGVLETAGDATAKLVDLIGRDAARMKANLADSVSELEDMAKSAQQLASDINQGAEDAVGPERVLQAMREADTPEELKEMLSESRQDVKEWSDALGKLADAGVHDGMLQTLIEAGPEGKKQAERLANSIGDPLFSIVQAHMHRTDGIIEDTVRDVGKHADLAAMQGEEVGSAVGQGVVDGILSQSDMIIGTFRNVMKGAVEQSKDELGIASPSKVFMEMGAGGIMAGLQRGIESKERDVARTLADAMPSAVGGDGGGSPQKVEQHIHLESRGDIRDDAQQAKLALMR